MFIMNEKEKITHFDGRNVIFGTQQIVFNDFFGWQPELDVIFHSICGNADNSM